RQLAPRIAAVEQRNRIEVVAEVPQVREQVDWTVRQCDAARRCIAPQALAQRQSRVAEVVALVEAGPVPSVVAEQRRDAHQLRNAVDIQERHEQPVRKLVPPRLPTPMPQRAEVEGRLSQHFTPSDCATRIAEFSPSSWKP